METRTRSYESPLVTEESAADGNGRPASEQIRAKLAAALETARLQKARLQEKTRDGAMATDRAVRSHPYESLGIALAFGLLVGILIRR
jgi:ElaB/YqjD/DUF883 family membrane-anchored ribosome-binding protein